MTKIPSAPPGTGTAGRRLWRAIMTKYTLQDHEMEIMRQLVTVADNVTKLDDLAAGNLIIQTPSGPKPHPAVVEARQQRLLLGRLLAQLRLPVESDDGTAVPQYRGPRGFYDKSGTV